MPPFLDSILRVFAALAAAKVRYLLVGGYAIALHGHKRVSDDIDLVVALDRENTLRTIGALQNIGYNPTAPVPALHFAEPQRRNIWIREKHSIVFQFRTDIPRDVTVDLFLSEPFDFAAAHRQALKVELGPGLPVFVAPVAALIAMKELSARPMDLEDIRVLNHLHQHANTAANSRWIE